MIRWCAYCQRYQGEVEPFEDYSMTHTICDRCIAREAYRTHLPQELEFVRRFFTKVARGAEGPAPSAKQLVAEGAALGLDPVDLLLGIVQPVLRQIGDLWARGQATVAEEHRVTTLCSRVIQLILEAEPRLDPEGTRQARPPTVLLVSAEGNQHTLGLQILEVLLLRNRIATFSLYPGRPTEEVVNLVRSVQPHVVGISAALPEHSQQAIPIAARLGDLPPATRPLVVVGGLALRSQVSLPASLHVCRDLSAFLDLVRDASSAAR